MQLCPQPELRWVALRDPCMNDGRNVMR
jgi:hypothetical protein